MELDKSTLLTPVQVNINDVLYKLEHDAEFFIHFFLGEELTKAVPEFHKTIFKLMTHADVPQFVCAIPRDHAKTTLAKLACVWYFLFSKFRFIIYVSNTSPIAGAACLDIIAFIESDNFKSIFGTPLFDIRREGDGIYKFRIGDKLCILRAAGAGVQVRGINIDNQRPQLAIIDDLEDNDNIATDHLFMKLKRWFYGPFNKCLDKFDNKKIHLGNMISNRTMLREHCESPYWHSMRYGALLSNGEALWPDAWPLEKLRADFQQYREAGLIDVWFAEMMNLPMAGGSGLIKAEEITYKPILYPGIMEFGFITIDPAISDKSWAHKAALVVHGFYDGTWQIVDYITRTGLDPIQLFEECMKLAFEWQINVVGIEDVAYQASIKHMFNYLCEERNIEGMEFVPLSASGKKTHRLASWAAMLKTGDYALNENDFLTAEQLLMYNPREKDNEDDLIDACAYGPQMIDNYLNEITNVFTIRPEGKPMTSYQLSQV